MHSTMHRKSKLSIYVNALWRFTNNYLSSFLEGFFVFLEFVLETVLDVVFLEFVLEPVLDVVFLEFVLESVLDLVFF